MKKFHLPRQLIVLTLLLLVPLSDLTIKWVYTPILIREENASLAAIASLKAQQIENWMAEREGDGKMLSLAEAMVGAFDPRLQAQSMPRLELLAEQMRTIYRYDLVAVADLSGKVIFTTRPIDKLPAELIDLLALIGANGSSRHTNLYAEPGGQPQLDWAFPIRKSGAGETLGFLILRTDPAHFLYPLIQSWPGISESGETLLVRRDGDSVQFLNDLRNQRNVALTLRISIDQEGLPAAFALKQGRTGTVEGKDYRSRAVMTAFRPVADTDWMLVAKIDRQEALAPLERLRLWNVTVTMLAALAIGSAWLVMWRRNELMHLQLSAKDQAVAATAFESMDGMIILDAERRILRVNRAFTQITGYEPAAVIGHGMDVMKPDLRHQPTLQRALNDLVRDQKPWVGEVVHHRKSGDPIHLLTRLNAVRDDAGEPTNYVVSFTDITEQKQAKNLIRALEFYDPLTHVPNRRHFTEHLQTLVGSNALENQFGAVICIDLDNFKALNDAAGHEIGDQMLVEMSHRLLATVQSADFVARINADEFALVLAPLSGSHEEAAALAKNVARRALSALASPFVLGGQYHHMASSAGLCLFSGRGEDSEEIYKRADLSLHQAKKMAGEPIFVFDPATQAALDSRYRLTAMLRAGIPQQLELFYQPQVDDSRQIFGAECLIRWRHPEMGLISPAMFIPLAEESGLIVNIGDWVTETACHQLKAWESVPSRCAIQLAVNVSARQFHADDFVDKIAAILKRTGADPNRLKLELTESMLVESLEAVATKMTLLKELGISLSLDDFGTGYSSLSYLRQLPLDQVKIDQSFVRNLAKGRYDDAIVKTIVSLGRSLDLAVIAEGVETEAQRESLAEYGCHNYQGYLFGKPMEIASFEAAL